MIQYHIHPSRTLSLQLRKSQRYYYLSRSQAIPLQLRIDRDCNLILLQVRCQASVLGASALPFRPSVKNIRIINSHDDYARIGLEPCRFSRDIHRGFFMLRDSGMERSSADLS